MALKFFKLLGRILFVLIFITTGYEKLSQPNKFIPILTERYTKFDQFLKEKGIQLPVSLRADKIVPQMKVVNQLIAYEMITFGLGVLCFIPYMSLGISLHLIVFTLIMNNPLYHRYESAEFYHEFGQVILSIGAFGISIMFFGEVGDSETEEKGLKKVEEVEVEEEVSGGEKAKKVEKKENKEKKEKKEKKSKSKRDEQD